MALAATAAVSATTAAAAYLDAKYHIRKDLRDIYEKRQVRSLVASRVKAKKLSLWYAFEETALSKPPQETCLWYRDPASSSPSEVRYTWRDTYDNCCRWGEFLLSQGVQPGELVGTYLINSPEFVFNMVGLWGIGCAPALINYHLAGEGLVHCLKVAGGKVLVVDADAECRGRIEEVRDRIEGELGMRIIVLDEEIKRRFTEGEAKRPGDQFRKGVTGEFPIFLFYTSGTTGFPKACAFQTQRAYVLGFPRLRTTGVRPGDTWYDCMPLYHGTGCTIAVGCMMNGVTLAIGRKFSVRNFWKDVSDSKASAFVYVGETARYLLAAPPSEWDRKHQLKAMYGNGMRPDVWSKFQERFNIPTVNEFFNSTEGMLSLLNVCRGPFHAAHVGHQGALQRWQNHDLLVPVAIDHETGGGENIWRDPKTKFARRNTYDEGGEILVKCGSEKDFVGYWGNPDATAKRFERDVFVKGDLYYRTGDALRRDSDGRWFFLDRLGDTYRWKSENVSTAEVAEVLGRFPGLVEANVYGVEVPGHDGRAGCAAVYIRPEDRPSFDWAALLEHARRGLPKYAVPVFIRMIKSPTPMHNNKQNKVPLRKEGVDVLKIRGGDAGPEDVIMYARPGSTTYLPYGDAEWRELVDGKARL